MDATTPCIIAHSVMDNTTIWIVAHTAMDITVMAAFISQFLRNLFRIFS